MLLTNKRAMIRNKCDWDSHFMCVMYDKPYGIWINLKEAKEKGREETLREIDDLLMKLS